MKKPKKRGMYAIKSGDRIGGFLIFIREYDKGETYSTLFIPDPMESLFLNKEEVHSMITNKGIDFVKKLPKDVYDVCKENFKYYLQIPTNDEENKTKENREELVKNLEEDYEKLNN